MAMITLEQWDAMSNEERSEALRNGDSLTRADGRLLAARLVEQGQLPIVEDC
jgi:hypothetical protein